MKKWEYDIVFSADDILPVADLKHKLKEKGEKGWEVVTIMSYGIDLVAWLKREIPND